MSKTFNVKLFEDNNDYMPVRANGDDAGFDLFIRGVKLLHEIKEDDVRERWTLKPGERVLVMTGVFLELTPGWEAQIRPRSGMALKNGITLTNSPGTIDAGYRNEIGVILEMQGGPEYDLVRGDRVAQMVVKKVPSVTLVSVDSINENTGRGLGGFGSSGQ